MARRSTFPLVDKALGGTLASELLRLRAEGNSYDAMLVWFSGQGIEVSRETVRRWVRDLDGNAA